MMRYAGIATEHRVQPAHMKGLDVFVAKLHMLHLRVVRRMQFGSGIVKITRLRALQLSSTVTWLFAPARM